MKALAPIHLRALLRLVDSYGENAFLTAATQAQDYRRFDAKAVERILERYYPVLEDTPVAPLGGVGSTQAEDVAVLLDEATVEKLLDYTRLEVGARGEVEPIESFDDAQVRTLEAPLEPSSLASRRLGTKQTQPELRERGRVFLGSVEQSGQGVGEGRQVEIDGELEDLFPGVRGSRASCATSHGYPPGRVVIGLRRPLVEVEPAVVLERAGVHFRKQKDTDNRHDVSATEIVYDANARCNQENLIAQLKSGVHALKAPVDNLESNWAFMVMVALAWSLNFTDGGLRWGFGLAWRFAKNTIK